MPEYRGLTIALYRDAINHFSSQRYVYKNHSKNLLPSEVVIMHCSETFMLAFFLPPGPFSFRPTVSTLNRSSHFIVHYSVTVPCA